jgi:hypothetical protein
MPAPISRKADFEKDRIPNKAGVGSRGEGAMLKGASPDVHAPAVGTVKRNAHGKRCLRTPPSGFSAKIISVRTGSEKTVGASKSDTDNHKLAAREPVAVGLDLGQSHRCRRRPLRRDSAACTCVAGPKGRRGSIHLGARLARQGRIADFRPGGPDESNQHCGRNDEVKRVAVHVNASL